MLKIFFLLHASLLSTDLLAAEFSLISPCNDTKVINEMITLPRDGEVLTVGDISIATLDSYEIPYLGTQRGFNSILNTPTGLDSLIVLDDNEMLSYGWCFSVNEKTPEVYPDQYVIEVGDQIVWWYGYAHYKNGEWIDQCVPASSRTKPEFCHNAKAK